MTFDFEANMKKNDDETTPPSILIYGMPGLGKSTFSATAPNPSFLDVEKGAEEVCKKHGCKRVTPESFQELLAALDYLIDAKHDFKTVVLDSLDWTETLIHKHICDTYKIKSIEDDKCPATSYKKGYIEAVNIFTQIRDKLDVLREKKKMIIIITAHSAIKAVKDPIDGDYDAFVIKTHQKLADSVTEWVKVCFMVKQEVITSSIAASGKKSGETVLLTKPQIGVKTKNRYDLPPQIPCNWNAFVSSINNAMPPVLRMSSRCFN